MIVENDKVVSIQYALKNPSGELLDSSKGGDPLKYLHGAGNIIPGLEAGLNGKTAGDELSIVIEPKDAYGTHDASRVARLPKDNLGPIEGLAVGVELQAQTPSGPLVVRVVEIDDDTVTVDANHPLAGVPLHFDVTVVDVRDATPEEIANKQPAT
jgi:FKBP-type peptidyl-prolyl cis-trans isomerase SlyD